MIDGSVMSGSGADIPEIELENDEVREARWSEQRKTKGFDDTELWNLDITILEFIIPRLKAFREMERWGTPCNISMQTWNTILDRIIEGFELYLDDEWTNRAQLENIHKKFKIAMKLFAKWFGALWD